MTFSKSLRLAACVFALSLAGACGQQTSTTPDTTSVGAGRTQDWKDLDADLAKNSPMAALRQHYQTEYTRFVDDMMDNFAKDIAENPDRTFGEHREEARERSVDFVMMMIQRDKIYTVNAPVERLQEWVRAYSNLLTTIKTQRGEQLCADYVAKGGEALSEDTSFMALQWNDMNAALINAMAEGRAKAKERVHATQQDFDAMTAWAIESGVDEDLVRGVQAGQRSDPASVCDFMIGMTASLAEMPGEEGDRMRLKIMLDILLLQLGEVKVIMPS